MLQICCGQKLVCEISRSDSLHVYLSASGRVSHSLLYQLNNALRVHKEDLSLGLLVKSGRVAVEDVRNLGHKQYKHLNPTIEEPDELLIP